MQLIKRDGDLVGFMVYLRTARQCGEASKQPSCLFEDAYAITLGSKIVEWERLENINRFVTMIGPPQHILHYFNRKVKPYRRISRAFRILVKL